MMHQQWQVMSGLQKQSNDKYPRNVCTLLLCLNLVINDQVQFQSSEPPAMLVDRLSVSSESYKRRASLKINSFFFLFPSGVRRSARHPTRKITLRVYLMLMFL